MIIFDDASHRVAKPQGAGDEARAARADLAAPVVDHQEGHRSRQSARVLLACVRAVRPCPPRMCDLPARPPHRLKARDDLMSSLSCHPSHRAAADPRHAWVLSEIDSGRPVRRPQVRDGLGIPEITARRLLERMAHDGLIVFEGEPGQGSYQRVVAEH